ncbi:MAG TPA: kinase/pyrophosphorylase [Hellea balneolensis]|uniref:Putative pyruvate, phosphate dikinase regulatory protein n=1 Tax=Hellea balneolensis TaxID=287478 RepID=A0A7C5R130_9PROT|nr:kinase/pyrophosphorylase [Hellea balneolensis]
MRDTPKTYPIYFHIHLVSDSTGETLVALSRAACSQFPQGVALEHLHALVRSEQQMNKVLEHAQSYPGIVFYTIVNSQRRRQLEKKCRDLKIPAVPILDPALATLGRYLGAPMSSEVGAQRNLDQNYFSRISALDFTMAHDDGQSAETLDEADILLLGISRTSKTPTCIYLANRGFKAANIPLVPGAPLPENVTSLKNTLIVGLISTPDRILEIRKQRLSTLGEVRATEYTDSEAVRAEMMAAKRLFAKHRWPYVDVSRRSIEETAARIINLYQDFKNEL